MSMSKLNQILIIEDDTDLRELIAEELVLQGDFSVRTALSAAIGLELAQLVNPNLILLDLNLPDKHGLEVIKILRKRGVFCPILVLTVEIDDTVVIETLEAGANDVVMKPFRCSILIARIRAHIYNHTLRIDASFSIGETIVDPIRKLLIASDGNKRALTEKEFYVLKYLHKANEKVVNIKTLYTEVWGYSSEINSHVVETQIYRLRQKIEPNPKDCVHLISVKGGYQLIH